jgi:hypothetical protein
LFFDGISAKENGIVPKINFADEARIHGNDGMSPLSPDYARKIKISHEAAFVERRQRLDGMKTKSP